MPSPPVPPGPAPLPLAASAAVRRRLLLTVLFLGAVGLQRTWDLRGYTADGLALLTGRTQAYGYRYTEALLSQVARADGAERFTNALACWTTLLWHPPENETGHIGDPEQPQTLTCYIDGHRKPVYSDVLLPRGLIGRLGVILGCRALLLLHDEQGHPLFATTHRGDQHLTVGVPTFLKRYEQHAGNSQVKREDAIIVAETESNISILKQYVKATRPGSFFTTSAGGLGFDLPAAAGLALAQRRTGQKRQVIAVIGDGAFQYSIQALYTMAQHRLPLTVIVPRNEEYAVLKAFAELEHTPGVPGLDLPGLDIVSQAKGFGVDARSVANPYQLRQVLQEALAADGPMVVEVPITKAVPPLL